MKKDERQSLSDYFEPKNKLFRYTCWNCHKFYILENGPTTGELYCPFCGVKEPITDRRIRSDSSYHFLNSCQSKPLILDDLNVGDRFIWFPGDGDDSGHGGLKGGERVLVKIEPYHSGTAYAEELIYTCHGFGAPEKLYTTPLSTYVIKLFGI